MNTFYQFSLNERGRTMVKFIAYTYTVAVLLLLSSCIADPKDDHSISSSDKKQILFFTDQKMMEKESIYYDALLDLKKQFPEEMDNMMIYQADHPESKRFNIKTYPSIIVMDHDGIILHIKGSVSTKDEIVEPVSEVLSE
mgnify:CR=1 FL=1